MASFFCVEAFAGQGIRGGGLLTDCQRWYPKVRRSAGADIRSHFNDVFVFDGQPPRTCIAASVILFLREILPKPADDRRADDLRVLLGIEAVPRPLNGDELHWCLRLFHRGQHLLAVFERH